MDGSEQGSPTQYSIEKEETSTGLSKERLWRYKKDLRRGYSLLLVAMILSISVDGLKFVNVIRNLGRGVEGIFGLSCFFLNLSGLIEIAAIIAGVYLIYISKEYFVDAHEDNIEIAGKMIIIWAVLLSVSFLVTTVLRAPVRYLVDDSAVFGSSNINIYIVMIISLLVGLSISLIYIYLTKELVSKKIESIMWSGLIAKLTISISAFIILVADIDVLNLTGNSIDFFVLLRSLTVFGSLLILTGVAVVFIEKRWKSEKYRRGSITK